MPGYVSHTVMARDIYNKINNKNINLEYFETYSLGGDLCKYAKCRYDSHHKDMDKFIYNMADYLKDNNLLDDSMLLSTLYGHICHYIMDDTIHPLVRKMDKTCLKNKHNHTLIEFYYDSYLTEKIFNLKIKDYTKKGILNGKTNRKISRMIDYAYLKTYNTSNVSKYYKFNIFLYRLLNTLFILFNTNLLYKIFGVNKFIKINNSINIVNDEHKILFKDYKGKECSDNLIALYNVCIDRAIKYIDDINKYLNI